MTHNQYKKLLVKLPDDSDLKKEYIRVKGVMNEQKSKHFKDVLLFIIAYIGIIICFITLGFALYNSVK
jgi:hypothetical protein